MRVAGWLLAVAATVTAQAQVNGKGGITLPAAPAVAVHPVTDSYGSVNVTDNYRWLEDAKSPETRAYIAAQNAYTNQYLSQLKMLPSVRTQMAALLKVDQMSTPQLRGGKYYFTKRLADENQGSIYMRESLHEPDIKLIDGNTRSGGRQYFG